MNLSHFMAIISLLLLTSCSESSNQKLQTQVVQLQAKVLELRGKLDYIEKTEKFITPNFEKVQTSVTQLSNFNDVLSKNINNDCINGLSDYLFNLENSMRGLSYSVMQTDKAVLYSTSKD